MRHKADIIVAREILLYVAQRCTNMYHVLKIIYFADKEHLMHYGQLMYGDRYVAMSHGPVPSAAYTLVKYARGDETWNMPASFETGFQVKKEGRKYHIIPVRQANTEFLSEAIIECLDSAISKYGKLSFSQLKEISHDEAYQSADENDFISLHAIINTLPDSEMLLDYVHAH